MAAQHGHRDAVKMLINAGASVSAVNKVTIALLNIPRRGKTELLPGDDPASADSRFNHTRNDAQNAATGPSKKRRTIYPFKQHENFSVQREPAKHVWARLNRRALNWNLSIAGVGRRKCTKLKSRGVRGKKWDGSARRSRDEIEIDNASTLISPLSLEQQRLRRRTLLPFCLSARPTEFYYVNQIVDASLSEEVRRATGWDIREGKLRVT